MTIASAARLAIGLAGAIAVAWFMARGWSWGGVIGALVVWSVVSVAAEAVFRRLASAAEIRADLEDRTRNTD